MKVMICVFPVSAIDWDTSLSKASHSPDVEGGDAGSSQLPVPRVANLSLAALSLNKKRWGYVQNLTR